MRIWAGENKMSIALQTIGSILPGVALARRYPVAWLRQDVLAGLGLTALLVPQGMAYAGLAGLPAVTGLYATLVPLIAYAVVGPSRILVLGPDSVLAPVIVAAIVPLAGDDQSERVALAGLLALMVGGLLLAGAVARLGFLTDLLSKPVRMGCLAGIAFLVMIDQVPQLLGYRVDEDNVFGDLGGLVRGLDRTDSQTAMIGVAGLGLILVLRQVAPAVPGVLIAVAASAAVSSVFALSVAVIGPIPAGLPNLAIPSPATGDSARLVLSACAIALLAFADTSVLSRSYASRLGEPVDQSRELAALGMANLASGLFQGFPISSSASRTPAAEALGAKSQLTGAVAAGALALVLVGGASLLRDIPQAALAAIVISAVVRLFDLQGFSRLLRVNRADAALAVISFAGVAGFGVLAGVGIAIGVSVLALLQRAWHPYVAVLGRVSGLKGYHDISRHPEAREVPGLLLFRFDAPLFFANAEVFRSNVYHAMQAGRRPIRIVIAAEPITDVDSTAADVLVDVQGELERKDIELAFAELKDPVKDSLRRYGILDRIGEDRFYPTIGLAVRSFVKDHGVDWRDWEDEEELV